VVQGEAIGRHGVVKGTDNMTTYDWRPFLERLSRAVLESPYADSYELPPDVVASAWLGFPGATEEQIAAAEARLGTTFPPSYRAFLKVTNGWQQLDSSIDKVWSVEDVEWFRTRHQEDWIDLWTEGETMMGELPRISDEQYFVYGPEQDCVHMRSEYLSTALEISDIGDSAILLLNPEVTTPDGEWEAWFYATWQPGATRYRSFWDLMQAHYEGVLRETENDRAEKAKRLQPTDTPETIRAKLAGLLQEIEDKAQWYAGAAHKRDCDMGEHATAHALRAVAETVRRTTNVIDDPTQLSIRLATIASEFEHKSSAILSQIRGSAPPKDDLLEQLEDDETWQQWCTQSQAADRPLPLPSELQQKMADLMQTALQRIGPHLMQNLPERGEAEGYRQGAVAIRSYLKNTTR
jgi:cell wall assembly regulator SMI1